MGANQSTRSLPNEKLLIERLRALEVRNTSEESEFVLVDEKETTSAKKSKAPWVSLSASALKTWETELLKDSKNRLVHFGKSGDS